MAIILSLLMAAITITPALAAYDEEVELSPSNGQIGEDIEVHGWDFTPSTFDSQRWVDIYLTDFEADPGDKIGIEVDDYEKWAAATYVGEEGDSDG